MKEVEVELHTITKKRILHIPSHQKDTSLRNKLYIHQLEIGLHTLDAKVS
jgi:hypothetical protein